MYQFLKNYGLAWIFRSREMSILYIDFQEKFLKSYLFDKAMKK